MAEISITTSFGHGSGRARIGKIMSWSESFPVMDQAMVEEFEDLATDAEKAELEELYGVAEVFNRQEGKRHVLATSLFWKPSNAEKTAYPVPTLEILQNASQLGLDLRFDPWSHYVEPILDGSPLILEKYDDVVVRVYLAADLDFLIQKLVNAGCEVYLMKHPSLAHAPGVAWRLLAFGDEGREVTIVDSDRFLLVESDIERTNAMKRANLAAWRSPVCSDLDHESKVPYKAMIGCHLGGVGGWPMKLLLEAFTWQMQRGTIQGMVEVPGCGLHPINHGEWPNFGFEEWFLTVVMYPRMAAGGILTLVPASVNSTLLCLDIEYAVWANPNSQLVFFSNGNCCKTSKKPSDEDSKRPEKDFWLR